MVTRIWVLTAAAPIIPHPLLACVPVVLSGLPFPAWALPERYVTRRVVCFIAME